MRNGKEHLKKVSFMCEDISSPLQLTFTAKFLYTLGLKRCPPLKIIIGLCASSDVNVRALALKYFLDHRASRYSDFDPTQFPDIAFIPALDQTAHRMAIHNEASSCSYHIHFINIDTIPRRSFQAPSGLRSGSSLHTPLLMQMR